MKKKNIIHFIFLIFLVVGTIYVIRNHQMAQGFFYRYDLYEKRILVVLYGVFTN